MNDVTNYKLRDKNIKDILDIFLEDPASYKINASEQINFFESILSGINSEIDKISESINLSIHRDYDINNFRIENLIAHIWDNNFIAIDDLLPKDVEIYDKSKAHEMIVKEDREAVNSAFHGIRALFDKTSHKIYIWNWILENKMWLAMLFHEIGHSYDPWFLNNRIFMEKENIPIDNPDSMNNEQTKILIWIHSDKEIYANNYMIKLLSRYKYIPWMKQYIKISQKLADHMLMILKYQWMVNQLLDNEVIFSWEEYIKLYKKN